MNIPREVVEKIISKVLGSSPILILKQLGRIQKPQIVNYGTKQRNICSVRFNR
jgi:hypothetical protein